MGVKQGRFSTRGDVRVGVQWGLLGMVIPARLHASKEPTSMIVCVIRLAQQGIIHLKLVCLIALGMTSVNELDDHLSSIISFNFISFKRCWNLYTNITYDIFLDSLQFFLQNFSFCHAFVGRMFLGIFYLLVELESVESSIFPRKLIDGTLTLPHSLITAFIPC